MPVLSRMARWHVSQLRRVATLFFVLAPALVLASAMPLSSCAGDDVLGSDDLPPSGSVTPQLYATGFEFAEGPALDNHGNLFVVNYRGLGNIGRITPDGTASVWCNVNELAPLEEERAQANGLKIDGEDRLIVADAGGGRVLRISADGTEAEVLAERCEGRRLESVNDVALDVAGNIYFSDPGGSNADNPVGSVYRYDIRTRKVTLLAEDLAFPNGLAVTPDQKQLCVVESKRYRILLFDLSPEGVVNNRRVLIDFPTETLGDIKGGKFEPDGIVFDEKSRLYVAMWSGAVINVVEVPSGKLLRQYNAGGTNATNCHFHGRWLYTTIASKEAVFRLELGVKGFEYALPSGQGAESSDAMP